MSDHTPGPWVRDDEYDFWIYGGPQGANSVCKVDSARAEADIALILQAPNMLAALERANVELSALVPDPSNTQRGDWPEELNGAEIECLHAAFITIRAAIAKATTKTLPKVEE